MRGPPEVSRLRLRSAPQVLKVINRAVAQQLLNLLSQRFRKLAPIRRVLASELRRSWQERDLPFLIAAAADDRVRGTRRVADRQDGRVQIPAARVRQHPFDLTRYDRVRGDDVTLLQ